jgi:hypothetical protein
MPQHIDLQLHARPLLDQIDTPRRSTTRLGLMRRNIFASRIRRILKTLIHVHDKVKRFAQSNALGTTIRCPVGECSAGFPMDDLAVSREMPSSAVG